MGSKTAALKQWLDTKWIGHLAYVFVQHGFITPDDVRSCSPAEMQEMMLSVDKPGHRLKIRVMIDDLADTAKPAKHVESHYGNENFASCSDNDSEAEEENDYNDTTREVAAIVHAQKALQDDYHKRAFELIAAELEMRNAAAAGKAGSNRLDSNGSATSMKLLFGR
jgi:hypothetical protein